MKVRNLHIIQKTWVNACRFLLAVAFIFSGFVKAVDPLGFQYKIQDYLEAFGMLSWFPSFFPLLAAVILSAIEFSIGVCLFFGIRKKTTTLLAFLLMIFMTPLTLYLALKNPVSDCGCFGDAWVLTNWETFGKNIVLFIDEIENGLHPNLVKLLAGLFNSNESNPHHAQLICTTHDTLLLDGVRRDQVWFTDKNQYGETSMCRLSDYPNVRSNDNIAAKYLQGVFGAIPNTQNL